MSQDLIFDFWIPVVLAFSMLILVLLAVLRVLSSMARPVQVRHPYCATPCNGQGEDAAWRRDDILQTLPARIVGADGIVPGIDPGTTNPDRDAGLFSV